MLDHREAQPPGFRRQALGRSHDQQLRPTRVVSPLRPGDLAGVPGGVGADGLPPRIALRNALVEARLDAVARRQSSRQAPHSRHHGHREGEKGLGTCQACDRLHHQQITEKSISKLFKILYMTLINN